MSFLILWQVPAVGHTNVATTPSPPPTPGPPPGAPKTQRTQTGVFARRHRENFLCRGCPLSAEAV